MIHCAKAGSLERFIGVLIEHHAGAFPMWLAPVQVSVVPGGRSSRRVRRPGCANGSEMPVFGWRSTTSDDTVGEKIRKALTQKHPAVIVVGDEDVSSVHCGPQTLRRGAGHPGSAVDRSDQSTRRPSRKHRGHDRAGGATGRPIGDPHRARPRRFARHRGRARLERRGAVPISFSDPPTDRWLGLRCGCGLGDAGDRWGLAAGNRARSPLPPGTSPRPGRLRSTRHQALSIAGVGSRRSRSGMPRLLSPSAAFAPGRTGAWCSTRPRSRQTSVPWLSWMRCPARSPRSRTSNRSKGFRTCPRAGRRGVGPARYRPGWDGRSSSSGRQAAPATGRSTRAAGPVRTER